MLASVQTAPDDGAMIVTRFIMQSVNFSFWV
jgi:hypothetical protein